MKLYWSSSLGLIVSRKDRLVQTDTTAPLDRHPWVNLVIDNPPEAGVRYKYRCTEVPLDALWRTESASFSFIIRGSEGGLI